MEELINRVTSQVGISPDQAKQALSIISQFIKEKFPAAGGMVDNLLSGKESDKESSSNPAEGINLGGFKL